MKVLATRAMYISMLSTFLEKKSERGLDCINARPREDGVQLAASNGAMLAVFMDSKAGSIGDEELCFTVPPEALKHCKCLASKPNDRWVVVHPREDGTTVCDMTVVVADDESAARAIASEMANVAAILYRGMCLRSTKPYPRYETLVPTLSPTEEQRVATFNGDYLSAFCQVATVDMEGRRNQSPHIRVYCQGEKGPSVVETLRTDFLGLVMPVAKAKDHRALPSWWVPAKG